MDRDDFQTVASELLEERVAEAVSPEREAIVPEVEAEQAPNRPQNIYTQAEIDGYSSARMDRQGPAALITNFRNNEAFFEHAAQAKQERLEQGHEVEDARQNVDESQKTLQENIEQSQTPPADLKQEFRQTAPEITDWDRYGQDREYRRQVNEQGQEQGQEQQQQLQVTTKRERERSS